MTIKTALEKTGIEANGDLLKTIYNLAKRYQTAGFNINEKTIVDYIISHYKPDNNNIDKVLYNLHHMKLSPIKKGDKINRNSTCPCGSKKKYKKCCINK